jgi:hypothetical protein
MLVCFIYFAREAAGALGTRLSLRPLFLGRTVLQTSGAISAARTRIHLEHRHCDPLARNDDVAV